MSLDPVPTPPDEPTAPITLTPDVLLQVQAGHTFVVATHPALTPEQLAEARKLTHDQATARSEGRS